jgi:hypothetical protein
MDVRAVRDAIGQVIKKHRVAFREIGSRQSALLELGAVTGVAQHYRASGYAVEIVNPHGLRSFKVKLSAKGYPWNFSHIAVRRGSDIAEIHMNVTVRSAHDEGIYCVDVGVTNAGAVPRTKPAKKWECVDNIDLHTFAEAKKLVIYPMLLAQFIGIVHEIKPKYLVRSSKPSELLPPALISLGHFSGNSIKIVSSYRARGIRVTIAENFDIRLARIKDQDDESPFGLHATKAATGSAAL